MRCCTAYRTGCAYRDSRYESVHCLFFLTSRSFFLVVPDYKNPFLATFQEQRAPSMRVPRPSVVSLAFSRYRSYNRSGLPAKKSRKKLLNQGQQGIFERVPRRSVVFLDSLATARITAPSFPLGNP